MTADLLIDDCHSERSEEPPADRESLQKMGKKEHRNRPPGQNQLYENTVIVKQFPPLSLAQS